MGRSLSWWGLRTFTSFSREERGGFASRFLSHCRPLYVFFIFTLFVFVFCFVYLFIYFNFTFVIFVWASNGFRPYPLALSCPFLLPLYYIPNCWFFWYELENMIEMRIQSIQRICLNVWPSPFKCFQICPDWPIGWQNHFPTNK